MLTPQCVGVTCICGGLSEVFELQEFDNGEEWQKWDLLCGSCYRKIKIRIEKTAP